MLQSPFNLMIKGGLVGVQGLNRCRGWLNNFAKNVCCQSTNMLQSLGEKGKLGVRGAPHTQFFSLDAIGR